MKIHLDFGEIIDAWIAAGHEKPDSDRSKLAEARMEYCQKCPNLKEILKNSVNIRFCGQCGCPISKKIFSRYENSCPLRKWTCDLDYFHKNNKKPTSLI